LKVFHRHLLGQTTTCCNRVAPPPELNLHSSLHSRGVTTKPAGRCGPIGETLPRAEFALDPFRPNEFWIFDHDVDGADELILAMCLEHCVQQGPLRSTVTLRPYRMTGWTMWVTKLRQASGVNFRLHDLRPPRAR